MPLVFIDYTKTPNNHGSRAIPRTLMKSTKTVMKVTILRVEKAENQKDFYTLLVENTIADQFPGGYTERARHLMLPQ